MNRRMTVVSFRTKRPISDLILNVESGSIVEYLNEDKPASRLAKVISVAVDISESRKVEVDVESTVISGRRPKRFELAFIYGGKLVVAGVAGKSELIKAMSRISKGVEVVRMENDRLGRNVPVIGYVFEFDSADRLTERQTGQYNEKGIFHGSIDELWGHLSP
jgi:hypothetical protein